ncbi:MAG: hypothetical protein BYD32DRAFT_385899, partial [Podila humilis]
MSGGTLTCLPGSIFLDNPTLDRKPYRDIVDQARAYAKELGPDLASAFDHLSDKTPLVLRAYIGSLCQEGHTYSKVECIRSAMKQYFEDEFHCFGTYWQFVPHQGTATIGYGDEGNDKDEERGEWIGNPTFDIAFVSMMHELQEQEERSEGTHQAKRRTAIGYDDMTKLMEHLQKPETVETEGLGHCLLFQAVAATAFALWLTFDEVLKLRHGHVRYKQPNSDGQPWFTITLPFRNSCPIDTSQVNTYEIHLQTNEPHACCVTKLLFWIDWAELKEGRQLQDEDFLFPHLDGSDQIQLDQPFSATQLSNLLNKYAADARIMDHRYNRLDTECFRRGGGQHRFFHIQDQWPLKAVKWWGGWS